MGLINWTMEKLSPSQQYISSNGTASASSNEPTHTYIQCYDRIEIVNRAVNMIVNDVAAIKHVVGDKIPSHTPLTVGVKKAQLNRILNKEPNPFQDVSSFKRALILDFLLDGNIFIYWDGANMFHIPATTMKVVSDPKKFISHYEYDGGRIKYRTDEIIHIKENSYESVWRGTSRLKPALGSMALILEMKKFQMDFFKNGATPGLVLETEQAINDRLKDRLQDQWGARYRPNSGGRRILILDNGMKLKPVTEVSFKDLDFQNAIAENEKIVLKALGVPPLLLDAGNNANIRPNHRLYYLETIIPIVEMMNSAFERFFGFDVYEDISYIHAMRPELREEAAYWSTLVNGGIAAPDEARESIGLKPMGGEFAEIRVPQNIAGSAANPGTGGRPPEDAEE